jgi:Fe-S oxidoreductase
MVMEESRFPQEVIPLFNNMERNQNPWEINNNTRADWAKGLDVPLLAEHPDAEVLYWVGCMAAFDQRNRKVATALVKVLKAANVDFAILGPEESCTGDPARRIGNEYLWQMLAQQNIAVLDGYGLNKRKSAVNGRANGKVNGPANGRPKTIVTACPHCFNTIRNEYPQLGGDYEVVHHTKFIEQLIATGKLQLPAGFDTRRLTYHDPCYIGRYNDIYDEPRQILNVINRNGITEMRRNRNRSFCCGGGGGRVWMEEKIGARVNQTRVQEALNTHAEVLAAACPFCITMFEDGIRGKNVEERLHVEDIAEILAKALDAASNATGKADNGATGAREGA